MQKSTKVRQKGFRDLSNKWKAARDFCRPGDEGGSGPEDCQFSYRGMTM